MTRLFASLARAIVPVKANAGAFGVEVGELVEPGVPLAGAVVTALAVAAAGGAAVAQGSRARAWRVE